MPMKMTTFFTAGQVGWSESFYFGTVLDRAGMTTLGQSWVGQRANLMGTGAFINYVRFSVFNAPPAPQGIKNSFVIKAAQNGVPVEGSFGSPADFSDTRILVKCYDSTGLKEKNWFLGGQPDSLVTDAGQLALDADWLKFFNQVTRFMKTNNFGWWAANSLSSATVGGVIAMPSNQLSFTVTQPIFAPFPLNPAYRLSVRFAGLQGCVAQNGPMTVLVTSPTTVLSERRFGLIPYTGGGRCSFTNKIVSSIQTFSIERAVERKAGRPSYQSRGRARARVTG